jgi:hypothetical protein
MQRKLLILAIVGLTMATGFAAKKLRPVPAGTLTAPKIPQMTDDQKALHALNRLTFGPRPGDLEQIKQLGVAQWIEQQLQPETIPENPILIAKLEPLDTLQMVLVQFSNYLLFRVYRIGCVLGYWGSESRRTNG